MDKLEKVIRGLEWCMNEKHDCYREKGCPYENECEDIGCKYALHRDALALLKAQEQRVTCSTCKYSRCLSGEWFCFMIGTSRYGKRVTDGDWYCKDAEGR